MSIFEGIPDDEQETRADWGDIIESVRSVNMRNLASYLGCTWDRTGRYIRCPDHRGSSLDRDPSGFVYPDHVFCFSCGAYYGHVDLICAVLGVDFKGAMRWLEENIQSLANVPAPLITSQAAEYNGPVPHEIAWYWHTQLTADRRAYLYGRLLLDRTIDQLWIGWRPDYECYTIPFWGGSPGNSEIDIIQYRHTRGDRRYTGMRGHNRPSVINRHLVGQHSVFLLFGTFDAILASQDGIAAVSTNGANAFAKDEDNLSRLREALQGCKVYVVPDRSDTEAKPAYVLAHALRAEVRHFPSGMQGKDYTDFRNEGHKPGEFIREVLMIGDGFIKPEHDEFFTDLLLNISVGEWPGAETIMQVFEHFYPIAAVVNQHIQLRLQFDPFPGLNHDQWEELRESIVTCLDYPHLMNWVYKGCQMGADNRGAF